MIATITMNPAVDQTVQVSQPLADGAVTRVDDARYDPGGKGINVSKYLTELRVDTVATGVVGGFLGRYLTDSLDEHGIETDFVDIDGLTRLNTTVLSPDAEYKLNQNGPTVTAEAIDAVIDRLETRMPERIVVAGSLPPGLDSTAIDRLARAGSWETVVDVDGSMLRQLDAHYLLCKPNVPELEAATGMEISSVSDAIAAAKQLRKRGFDIVLASLGADGAVLVSADTVVHEPAVPVEVVDTVGAGDSLLSGVLAALADGADDRTALRTGLQVAAEIVNVPGTTVPSLPDRSSLGENDE